MRVSPSSKKRKCCIVKVEGSHVLGLFLSKNVTKTSISVTYGASLTCLWSVITCGRLIFKNCSDNINWANETIKFLSSLELIIEELRLNNQIQFEGEDNNSASKHPTEEFHFRFLWFNSLNLRNYNYN